MTDLGFKILDSRIPDIYFGFAVRFQDFGLSFTSLVFKDSGFKILDFGFQLEAQCKTLNSKFYFQH